MSPVDLTDAQRWALDAIASGWGQSPATLGQRMMDRPGAVPAGRTVHYKAQGYGRMGGAMMKRLADMSLVTLQHRSHGHWHPTRAEMTEAGRRMLAAAQAEGRK